jgi:hypothetical protein
MNVHVRFKVFPVEKGEIPMARRNEFEPVGPNVSSKERPRHFEERGRWADEHEGHEQPTGHEEEDAGPIVQMMRRNPVSAVMTGFGLGFGFGLAITLLVTRREPSWFMRNVQEPLHQLPERLKHIPDSFGSYVPSSWKQWG